MALAEIPIILAARLAVTSAHRDTGPMRAQADHDEPVGMARLGAVRQPFGLAQASDCKGADEGLLCPSQVAHEHRHSPPDCNNGLTGLDRA